MLWKRTKQFLSVFVMTPMMISVTCGYEKHGNSAYFELSNHLNEWLKG